MSDELDRVSPEETPDLPSSEPPVSPPSREDDPTKRPGIGLYEWLQMLLGCILAAVIVFNCFARLTRVDGSSMENTLQSGEIMLVWSLNYQPRQGDIVVVNKTIAPFPGWDGRKALVKRVIATGGQTVAIDYVAGVVYVDGKPLDEPYIKEEMFNTGDPFMQQTYWEVPEDAVFVMGDNRNHSTDSRHSYLGCVDNDYILGKVVFSLWPFHTFGSV